MRITARRGQVEAHRQAEREITALFRAIVERVSGILLQIVGVDGVVPLERGEEARQRVRAEIEPLFVIREPLGGVRLQRERDRLRTLLEQARRELEGATGRQQARLSGRVRLLSARYALLVGSGISLTALRNGRPITPYAHAVLDNAEAATRAVVEAHAAAMRTLLRDAPDVLRWLGTASVRAAGFMNPLAVHQPVTMWLDSRGYALSDRIWNTSEVTLARIDGLLADGIAQGRAAVDMARDLRQFLLPSRRGITTRTPYGTNGSFDARRLARSEITRAHSVASYASGVSNRFVVRARYHLSASHDPKNCNGTCDEHYSRDQANGGFPPDEVPLPMLDTHPQCAPPEEMVETDYGPVAIEKLRVGELVMTHMGHYRMVEAVQQREFQGVVYIVSTSHSQFTLTGEHPALTARGWVEAEHLQVGDRVLYVNTNVGPFQIVLRYCTVCGIEEKQYDGPVYNLQVAEDESYTVNEAVVHNCMCYITHETANREEVIRSLRAEMQTRAARPPLTPLATEVFADLLMGYIYADATRGVAETR